MALKKAKEAALLGVTTVAQWNPVLLQLQHGSQLWLGSPPWPGNSICYGMDKKEKKEKERKGKKRKERKGKERKGKKKTAFLGGVVNINCSIAYIKHSEHCWVQNENNHSGYFNYVNNNIKVNTL